MLKGEYKLFPFGTSMEDLVTRIEEHAVVQAFTLGYDIIIDSTGFRRTPDSKFVKFLSNLVKIEYVDFTHVTLEECIERDANREISVGETVIKNMYNKYLK